MTSLLKSKRWTVRLGSLIAAGALRVGLAACACGDGGNSAGGSGNGGPIRVSIVADLTGAYATINGSALSGVLTPIDDVNDHGGVNGETIKVAGTYDAGSAADPASAAARSAIGDQPSSS